VVESISASLAAASPALLPAPPGGSAASANGTFAAALTATMAAQSAPGTASAPLPAGTTAAQATPSGATAAARFAPQPFVTLGAMFAHQGVALGTPVVPAAGAQPLWAGAAAVSALGELSHPGAAGAASFVTSPDRLLVPTVGRVSSTFGPRVHPVTGRQGMHSGLDIAAPTGTPIAAAAGGTVTFAGVRGGYGNIVIIDHGDGRETRYAHADRMLVQAGQRVAAGEQVATVGATGTATGPHLHLEVRVDGNPVDPRPLLGI
jgi:murein DD-endopeptidase MepM/ murein hydrolase activator NlpD